MIRFGFPKIEYVQLMGPIFGIVKIWRGFVAIVLCRDGGAASEMERDEQPSKNFPN